MCESLLNSFRVALGPNLLPRWEDQFEQFLRRSEVVASVREGSVIDANSTRGVCRESPETESCLNEQHYEHDFGG